ncbi:MAG TPA: aspartate/glutamate racemase family protein, partial [Beutenbergiaceae bacterium]|nr:aspartate/glutamate racemase family protein [Beutenbergiaceae bacterium]
DITDAAAHVAALIGRTFSVITTLDRTVPLIEDRLILSGLYGRCASVRASGLGVLELNDPEPVIRALTQEAHKAVEEDKAEVIILGCGGMAGLEAAIHKATNTPVVDGVAAAVALAESLVGLGLSTSKVRTYAQPLPKRVRSWPLHEHLA